MTINLKDIDLPCNDYLYVCTVEEFRKEYSSRLSGVNFKINKVVNQKLGKIAAAKNCLVLTLGPFEKLSDLPYICFNELSDLVFFQNFLTERVMKESIEHYSGAVDMVTEDLDGFQEGVLNLKSNHFVFNSVKSKKSKKPKIEYLRVDYQNTLGYSIVIFGKEDMPWKGKPIKKPDESRCFRIAAIANEMKVNYYFCVKFARNDIHRKYLLSSSGGLFVTDLWVARINSKLHKFKLKNAHEKILKSTGSIDCNSHVMEPVKYEIRLRVI